MTANQDSLLHSWSKIGIEYRNIVCPSQRALDGRVQIKSFAHTFDTYMYVDFANEFQKVLADEHYAWVMYTELLPR